MRLPADKMSLRLYHPFSGHIRKAVKSSLYCERRVTIKKSIKYVKEIMKVILKQSTIDLISLEKMRANKKCYTLVSLDLQSLVSAIIVK